MNDSALAPTAELRPVGELIDEICARVAPPSSSALTSSHDTVSEVSTQLVATIRQYPVQIAVLVIGAGLLAWWVARRDHARS